MLCGAEHAGARGSGWRIAAYRASSRRVHPRRIATPIGGPMRARRRDAGCNAGTRDRLLARDAFGVTDRSVLPEIRTSSTMRPR
jgi:hypothetical protein